jgi:hypothetical protein
MTIRIEVQLKTLEDELDRLGYAAGPQTQLYAAGARDTINWLIHGTTPASQGGPQLLFPMVGGVHVH